MLGLKPSCLEDPVVDSPNYNSVVIRVNNHNVNALIDSGASRNCVSEHYFNTCRISRSRLNTNNKLPLISASGASLQCLGTVTLDVNLQGLSFPILFYVIRNLSIKCILGIPFLQDTKAVVDFSNNEISLYDRLAVAPLTYNFDRESILSLTKSVTIPPRSEMFVPVKLHRKFVSKTLLVEGCPLLKHRLIAVAAALIEPQFTRSLCRVVNVGDLPKFIKRGTPIATVSYLPIDEQHNSHLLRPSDQLGQPKCFSITEETLPPHKSRVEALEKIGLSFSESVLTGNDLHELSELLFRNIDLFATDEMSLPGANITPHKFEMDTNRIIHTKQFRQPPHLTAELKRETQKLLNAGIIQRSKSLYNSPAFIIRKASGGYRFIVDLRAINKHIIKETESSINIEHVVLELSYRRPRYFSKLDFKCGFFQIPLHPDVREKTAFETPAGKCHFARLPQGLSTSPSAFLHAMHGLFSPELYESLLIYVDDIVLYSPSIKDHLNTLSNVFQKLRDANLRMSPDKCSFFLPKIQFLGFEISQQGLRVNPKRFDAIESYPSPRNIKETRSLLGLFQYFKKFIPRYSQITSCIRTLITKEGSQ